MNDFLIFMGMTFITMLSVLVLYQLGRCIYYIGLAFYRINTQYPCKINITGDVSIGKSLEMSNGVVYLNSALSIANPTITKTTSSSSSSSSSESTKKEKK